MTETLREFLSRRLQELADAEAPLRAELSKIEQERKELERAARHAGIINSSGVEIDGANLNNRRTIKEAVLEILEKKPNGLTAMDILKELKTKMNMPYARTSLSPQLSRLKRDGKVRQDGVVWSRITVEK
jgi:hypothetical protein